MTNRRKFISTAAIAAAPLVLHAQSTPDPSNAPVTLRVQSAFPPAEMLNSFGTQWAERVNALGAGRLRIELMPVGTVAKTFEVVTAVSQGKLDGGFTYSAYQHALHPAISLWCAGPAFGMDSRMLLAWHQFGGGKDLLAQLYKAMKLDVTSIPFMPLPTQPLGWFKTGLTKVEDIKGLRFRTAGLALEVMNELGALSKPLPGSEIGPAIQRGELDGGEFNNTSSDRSLGINKYAPVCMVQSYAEATGCLEMVFNTKTWAALAPEHRALLETVANAMSAEGPWQMAERNSIDYQELAQSGTQFLRTPAAILQAQLNAWDRVIAKHAGADPLFAAIIRSQKEYAKRATRWESDITPDYRHVYNHYFNRRVV